MGRKKIRIARITDDRNRSVTYLKRKAGLMKKAHELAVLTGSEVAVIVFGQNGKLSEFCSGDMDHLLLRYTDHKGPVERKGPEHYSNDNDDDDDDDIGGDYDDGEDDYDGSSGAAGGNTSNSRGGTDFNLNGGPSGGDGNGEMTGNGRSQKRKAPRGKTMSDAHSMSSDSSRRSSSPSTNASGIVSAAATMGGPMIKIEDENNLDRKNLKAAIIQKSLSKPRTESEILLQMNNSTPRPIGMQHHHSFSTGDFNFVHQSQNQQFGEQSRMEMGGLPGQMTPQRPSTAGSSGQVYYNSFATPQRQSPPRFAFNASSETTNINFGNPVPAQQSSFLSPGPVAFTTTTPTPPRNMVSPMNGAFLPANNQSTTYGDLARGGSGDNINQTMLAVPGQNNLTANHLQPGSPGVTNGSNASGLLPLAHPILRQHPQFESYSQQLRTQQQRNASVPLIHTAPPSPHFQVNANGGEQQIGSMQIPVNIAPGSTPNSPLPVPAFAKRSASFGMATSDSNGRLMVQQSAPSQQGTFVNPFGDGNGIENTGHNIQSAPLGPPTQPVIHSMMTSPAINPMASGAEDVNSLTGMSSSQHSHPPPPYAPMVNNTSTISGNTLSSGDDGISANSQQPISNAAFNDLMGSILGDMGSGGDGTEDEDVNLTVDSDRQTKQGQEDVLRSLDSDHSLSTLVNSESFDLVMSGNGTKPSFTQHIPKNSLDKTITRIDDAVLSTTLDASQDAP